jgi:DNA excision repair protein ERCC-4
MSLADGRLFPQAAVLAQNPHRPVVLLEGPRPQHMPDVHPNALKGAMVSLAVMWRLPVLHARDPEDSLRILRRLYVLQGLPGVGPALAHRLLLHFGSVERIMTADETRLMQIPGVGPKKAAGIRELVR